MIVYALALMLTVQTPISFTARAEPAWKVVRDLDLATGLKLKTAPNVSDEILVVDVHGVPIEELLTHIANTLDAEWVGQGDQRTLIRTPAKLEAMRKREFDSRVAEAKKFLDQMKTEAAQMPAWSDALASALVTQYFANEDQMIA